MKNAVYSSLKQVLAYLKDYRFGSILLKYFLLLFVCLILPVVILSSWYGKQVKENMQEEIIRKNEAALQQEYDNVNSIILSAKNLAYSLSVHSGVQYLGVKDSLSMDEADNLGNLCDTISVLEQANSYIDSICIYFHKSNEVVSKQGNVSRENYQDGECFEMYATDMPNRTTFHIRKKKDKYPYLITILYPISLNRYTNSNSGTVAINIDVEKMGEYIGSGEYRSTDDDPILVVLDEKRETMIYSDEYHLLREGIKIFSELKNSTEWKSKFSTAATLWGNSYMVSGIYSETDGFWYIYFTSMKQFEAENEVTNQLLRNIIVLMALICLIVAVLLSMWVYSPIQHTLQVLDNMSMLTEWDKKEHMDEMEMIQRSILSAKKKQDNLNEQIQERIVNLHNAQICALQTQINPHFLYNTLEAIGNAASIIMNGDNKVTEMIYTLGRLMRISLAGENYLVPIREEIEHVKLYVKLMEFRFRGRICMHIEIPEELYQERILKLTLQPLIENSIEHGLARKRSQGEIWVKGMRDGENLFLYVIDNGEGIPPEKLKELQNKLEISTISDSRHVGLRNVNQRLQLVFGEEYGLSVGAAKGGGMCVTICFKKISIEEVKNN